MHDTPLEPADLQRFAGYAVVTARAHAHRPAALAVDGARTAGDWALALARIDPGLADRAAARLAASAAAPATSAPSGSSQLPGADRIAPDRGSRLAGSGRGDPVDVVDRVDAAHRVEHPVQVHGVAHLEHEAAERQAVARSSDTVAERMFTWCSLSTRVTSDSSPERSSASTWICTRKTLFEVGAHSTSTMRSGSRRQRLHVHAVGAVHGHAAAPRDEADDLVAGHRACSTSRASPGCRARRARARRSRPRAGSCCGPGRGRRSSRSSVSSVAEISAVTFSSTDCVDTCPSPTAAYSAETSS